MTVYEYGDTVNLSWTEPSNTATVVLYVTAPDGTESSPATAYSSGAWRASLTGNQYDQWMFTWVSSGTFTGTEQDSFTVGGPWYGTLAALKFDVGRASTDTSADTTLARNLTSASRKVEEYCDLRPVGGFLLDASTSQRVFSTKGTICTDDGYRLPVNDIGHETITVEVGDGTTWTAFTAFEAWPDNALDTDEAITALVAPTTDWRNYRKVRVTARWGWPAVPSGVVTATLLQAMRLFKRPSSPEGVAGSAEWGLVRIPNLDPDVKSHLDKFHTPWLGR